MNEDQLLDKINKLENDVAQYQNIPSIDDLCVDGGVHDYPNPWYGITPPHCKKCGKKAKTFEITYENGTSAAGWNFHTFGGNIVNDSNFYCNSTYSNGSTSNDDIDQSGL